MKIKNKLNNHRGRFLSISVNRAKTGMSNYNAKIRRVTDKTVIFHDVKTKKTITVPLANIVNVK